MIGRPYLNIIICNIQQTAAVYDSRLYNLINFTFSTRSWISCQIKDLTPFKNPLSIYPCFFIKCIETISSLLWSCTFEFLWFRSVYFIHSDTDRDFTSILPTTSDTLPFLKALLLLNYFKAPLALVDCERRAQHKGPLMHVLMDLEKSSQCWDMWLIVAACSLPEQQGHTGAAGVEKRIDLSSMSSRTKFILPSLTPKSQHLPSAYIKTHCSMELRITWIF